MTPTFIAALLPRVARDHLVPVTRFERTGEEKQSSQGCRAKSRRRTAALATKLPDPVALGRGLTVRG
jgi:hypothetical protein